MPITVRIAALCACLLAAAGSAQAQEVTLEAGYTDYTDAGTDSAILGLGYSHTPFYEGDVLSAAITGSLNYTAENDLYVGVGIALRWAWDTGWFIDFSTMPGYYNEGSVGNYLGGDFQFRSLLGVGYQLENGQSLSLAVTHKSNASTNRYNPGADALLLRWHFPL